MDDHLPLAASDSDIDALLDDWLATPAAPLVTLDAPADAADAATPAEPASEMSLLAALAADALAIGAAEQAVITDGRAAAGRKDHYVIFTSAGSSYAVLETSVTEVSRIPKLTLVPRVPDWLRGVTSLRGEVLSVVDLRVFLGLEPTSLHTGRLLVVRLTDEEFSLGILVDTVDQIASVARDDVRPPAAPLEGALAPYLAGVARVGERLVAALDLDAMLRSADIRQFDDRKPE